ncbi:MAG: hypothetical protein RIC95_07060 [Vicingaceae bacterium]
MRSLKHRFYSKSKRQQRQVQIVIGFAAVFVMTLAICVAWLSGIYLIAIFCLPFLLTIIAPFFDTPSLIKSGKLKYHSLLFLSEIPRKRIVKVHGGTLFDYVFVLDFSQSGKQRSKFILQQYLEGLLALIEELETSGEAYKIQGTTYILNERTANRIGFKTKKLDFVQALILSFNYFNLLISQSLARKKLVFPKLTNSRTFEATLQELSQHKPMLKELNKQLQKDFVQDFEKNHLNP